MIDGTLVAKGIEFMKRQKAAGKPFFLYLPLSPGHVPNYPAAAFKGKSRIGQYGDKLMEGDYHVGLIMDALKELGDRREHACGARLGQRAERSGCA